MENKYSPVKKSIHGDEWYSPQCVVDLITPYVVGKFGKIWCPFDKSDSNFVKTFQSKGVDVVYGHIDTGQDFFDYDTPQGDVVVSNPPFSKRDDILIKLFSMKIPFALVMNFNGLFDSKVRYELFRNNDFEMLIPKGRMIFEHKETGVKKNPTFQSIYVCSGVLDEQIVFSDVSFYRGRNNG